MKRENIVKTIVIIVSLCFLIPTTIITTEKTKADETNKTYVYCWREAESYDWSWETDSCKEWDIVVGSQASGGNSVQQLNYYDTGDILRWDFEIDETGTYYFYIRGYYKLYGSDKVDLYWEEPDGTQTYLGSEDFNPAPPNYDNDTKGVWVWFKYSNSKYLESGDLGTLVLETDDEGWACIDNIVISTNSNYNPESVNGGKGIENSISHIIGGTITADSGDNTVEIDQDYIYEKTEELSDINDDVNWEQDGYGIPMGRYFGTEGEHRAAEYLDEWFDELGIHSYREQIAAYPNKHINDNIDVHAKALSYQLTEEGEVKTVTDFFIGPTYNKSYMYLLNHITSWSDDKLDTLTNSFDYTDLEVYDREDEYHTCNSDFDDIFEDFFNNSLTRYGIIN